MLLVVLLISGLSACSNPYTGEVDETPPPADPAFWFEDIYNDLLEREAGGTMGAPANCKYVCDLIKLRRPASPLVPAPGTELRVANCEYLLKMIDGFNECFTGRSTGFSLSKFATRQILDTIAVNQAIDLLWGPDGKFVASAMGASGTNRGRMMYSLNGTTWTAGGSVPAGNWNSIAYGNGVWVVAGAPSSPSTGQGNSFLYSTDGINWTRRNINTGRYNISPPTMLYGNGVFLMCGGHIAGFDDYAYSTDGINWNWGTYPAGILGINYGNGKFLAVGTVNSYESTDGINWTQIPGLPAGNWRYLSFAGNQFIMMDSNGGRMIYSIDGINWNIVAHASMCRIFAKVFYSGGLYWAIDSYLSGFSSSPNGVEWTERTLAGGINMGWGDAASGKGILITTNSDVAGQASAYWNGSNPGVYTNIPRNDLGWAVCFGGY